MYIEPKLNWSPSDFFNFHDMNRIESNMQVIVDGIREKTGKVISLESIETGRTIEYIDYFEDINRVERNLEKIRKNWIEGGKYMRRGGKQWTIDTPFTYEDAITWEYNIYVMYNFLGLDFISYIDKYCGEAYTTNQETL